MSGYLLELIFFFQSCSWPKDNLKLVFSFDGTFNSMNSSIPDVVVVNSPTFKRVNNDSLPFGTSVDFNYVMGDHLELDPTGLNLKYASLTVSLWYKRRTEATHMDMVTIDGESYGRNFYVSIRPVSGGKMINIAKDISGNRVYQDTINTYSLDVWYHLVMTHTNAPSGGMKIYVDTYEEPLSGESSSASGGPYDQPLRIGGGAPSDPHFYYDGEMACIHLYDRVLTFPEIQALYTDGCSCFTDYFYCFGNHYKEVGSVCNGHGQCVAEDLCECEEGYYGVNCTEREFCRYSEDNLVVKFPFDETSSFDGLPQFSDSNQSSISSTILRNHLGSEEANLTMDVLTSNHPFLPFGQAVEFSGEGDHLEVPISLNNLTEFSISVWALPVLPFGALPRDIVSVDSEIAEGREISIVWQSVNAIHVDGTINGLFTVRQTYELFPVDNQTWYHIVGTSNGSHIRIFVNGEKKSHFLSSSFDGGVPKTQPLRIGGGAPSGQLQLPWKGKLGCIHIFNSSISEEEVKLLYEDGCYCFTDYGISRQCFGVPWNQIGEVCSAHGRCSSEDKCLCDEEYFGDACNVTTCNGILSNETDRVCSGVGNCSEYEHCTCSVGYIGDECELFKCNGFFPNDTLNACNGRGTCSGPGICSDCDQGYYGEFCHLTNSFFRLIEPSFQSFEYTCDLSTSKPPARSRGAAFSFLNHEIYVFGGHGNENRRYNDVWRVNIGKKNASWCFVSGSQEPNISLSEYPSGALVFSPLNVISSRSDVCGFSSAFSFFVFGGIGVDEGSEVNEVWEFQIGTNNYHPYEWRILVEDVDSENTPAKRYGSCFAKKSSSSAILFGGKNSQEVYKNDLWEYDIMDNIFTLLNNGSTHNTSTAANITYDGEFTPRVYGDFSPYHRAHHICWMDSSQTNFFIFGGTLLDSTSSNDVFLWNSTESKWAYVKGGNSERDNTISTYYSYDSGNLPSVRSGSMFVNNQFEYSGFVNEVIFFGGMDVGDGSTWADVWSFSNILMEFKFVNGTTPLKNFLGDGSEKLMGSRGFGVAVMKRSKNVIILQAYARPGYL